MKKFRLLKDLPGLKAGTVIIYDKGEVHLIEGENTKWNNEYVRMLLANMIERWEYKGWLEEIKEPKSIYNLIK